MSSHSPTPSSGRDRTTRSAAMRFSAVPCMSERQAEAYLLARDAVRRVQRTTALVSGVSNRMAGSASWSHGDQHQSH